MAKKKVAKKKAVKKKAAKKKKISEQLLKKAAKKKQKPVDNVEVDYGSGSVTIQASFLPGNYVNVLGQKSTAKIVGIFTDGLEVRYRTTFGGFHSADELSRAR